MSDDTSRRVAERTGTTELLAVLAERLPQSDLNSLLLATFRRRAVKLRPADVLRRYLTSRFTTPSQADPATLARLTILAGECLPEDAEMIELSPVAPFGCVTSFSSVAQDSVLAAVRGVEVMSDPTNVMALEGARRRQALLRGSARDATTVTLSNSQRVVRAQRFQGAGQTQHFHLHSMCTVGRDVGSGRFELAALRAHLAHYLELLERVRGLGLAVGARHLLLTDFEGSWGERLERDVIGPIAADHPKVRIELAPRRERGRGYYHPLCFELRAGNAAGETYSLADGGLVPWTQQLLESRKERCFISAIGTEQLATRFRAPAEIAD